jgi:hypothetical protein
MVPRGYILYGIVCLLLAFAAVSVGNFLLKDTETSSTEIRVLLVTKSVAANSGLY